MDAKLAKKIYNVMCATENLEKNLRVGNGNNAYAAVGERVVLNMLKPLFKQEKLIVIPKDGTISEDTIEYTNSFGKNSLRAVTKLKCYFTIIDVETGESVDIVGFGNGADSQDKGSGKAFTYAFKTALNKSFMMFSGEDTDNTHSDDIGKQKPLSEAQIKRLYAIAKSHGHLADDVSVYCEKKYKKEPQQLTKAEYDDVCKRLEGDKK